MKKCKVQELIVISLIVILECFLKCLKWHISYLWLFRYTVYILYTISDVWIMHLSLGYDLPTFFIRSNNCPTSGLTYFSIKYNNVLRRQAAISKLLLARMHFSRTPWPLCPHTTLIPVIFFDRESGLKNKMSMDGRTPLEVSPLLVTVQGKAKHNKNKVEN